MGGSVRIITRESNGQVTKMTRWTNNLKYCFQTNEFIHNSHDVIKDYINSAELSEYNLKDPTFSPIDYGLIVIDDVNKLILSKQGYCDLSEYDINSLFSDIRLVKKINWDGRDEEVPFLSNKQTSSNVMFYLKRHYDLFMNNRLSMPKNFKEESSMLQENFKIFLQVLEKPQKSIDDWKIFLQFISDKSRYSSSLNIDFGEYKHINFNSLKIDEKLQYVKFKEKLDELKFNLSEKDLNDWQSFLSREPF